MKSPTEARLAAPDNLRGLLMILMAIDHANLFIAHRNSSEFWNGDWTTYRSAAAFLTRFVTHICAPGFFLLMGMGMYLFASARRENGWSEARIMRHFAWRGILLILLSQVLEGWAWKLGTVFQIHEGAPSEVTAAGFSFFPLIFSVLAGLGMAMMVGALLLHTGKWVGWFSVALLVLCNGLVPNSEHAASSYPIWMQFLLLPGFSNNVLVLYPLLPWLGVCGLGMKLGQQLRAGREPGARLWRVLPWLGLGSIAVAVLLRFAGGFGNIRPPRDSSWIEFLNFIKYPPALTFLLFMLGVDLLLLTLLRRPRVVLQVFGQAPLCFYFAHLFLYAGIGALLFRHPASPLQLYGVWLAGLLPLYFVCDRYRRFKETKPLGSLWRLF